MRDFDAVQTEKDFTMTHRLFIGLLALVGLSTSVRAQDVESFAEPYRRIDVAAAESGIVLKLHVKEGDHVAADQPLADLDQDVLKASLEIARAHKDADSSLLSAQAELLLREERLAKLEELKLSGNASEEEVRRASLERELAAGRVLAAKESLAIKKLEFERIQLQLDRRTIRSPIGGYVVELFREEGEFVAPTSPMIVTVVQLDPLLVTFPVPASQALTLQERRPVTVRIDGHEKPTRGEIELVSPVTNAESQTVRVRVRIPNPENRFRAGSKAWLSLGSDPTKLTVKPGTTRAKQ